MRALAVLLIVALCAGMAAAVTAEARPVNFWTEFDVAFWQTMPFAAFWGYLITSQLARGGAVEWNAILIGATAVSLANAYLHARQATK